MGGFCVSGVSTHPKSDGTRECDALELAGATDARERALAYLRGWVWRDNALPKTIIRRRTATSRVGVRFASRPKVLFADEPTGNLDHATGERVTQRLFELNRENDTTLVLVTHDSELASNCARRVEMSAGVLAEAA